MAKTLTRAGIDRATQREVVWHLARGCNKEQAAKRAGLASSGRLSHFTRSREFADALREGLLDRMANDLAPRAIQILSEIMEDDKVQPRVRVDACKALLDRSGYAAMTAAEAAGRDDRTLAEMSQAELTLLVRTLEAARTLEAKTIEGELAD